MLKKPNFHSFDKFKELEDFFGCNIRYIDSSIMAIHNKYGKLDWLKGKSKICDLPGYDKAAFVHCNDFIITDVDIVNRTLYWIVENNITGWAVDSILDGYRFLYHFYFINDSERALVRLSS